MNALYYLNQTVVDDDDILLLERYHYDSSVLQSLLRYMLSSESNIDENKLKEFKQDAYDALLKEEVLKTSLINKYTNNNGYLVSNYIFDFTTKMLYWNTKDQGNL